MNPIIAPHLSIKNASLSYEGDVLFEHLNLTLKAGQFTCLLGPSGVGKTSLLRLIAQLITLNPTESIHAHMICSNSKPLKNQIAYLAQNDSLLPWFNAMDNALLGARLRSNLTTKVKKRADELFIQVGLDAFKKKYPRQLSGGMRQRVALVRTLLEEKPIILMDEPLSSLDAITRFQLQTITSTLLKHRTVLLVTHDPMEALRLADKIYILSGFPASIQLALDLKTKTPRDPDDAVIRDHYAELLHALTKAKEISR